MATSEPTFLDWNKNQPRFAAAPGLFFFRAGFSSNFQRSIHFSASDMGRTSIRSITFPLPATEAA